MGEEKPTRTELAEWLRKQGFEVRSDGVVIVPGDPVFRASVDGNDKTIMVKVPLDRVFLGQACRLGRFRKNPVVLLMHRHEALPVGRSLNESVRGPNLTATVQLHLDTVHSRDAWAMIAEERVMGRWEVGVVPTEWSRRRPPPETWGRITEEEEKAYDSDLVVDEWELVEISWCPVDWPRVRRLLNEKKLSSQHVVDSVPADVVAEAPPPTDEGEPGKLISGKESIILPAEKVVGHVYTGPLAGEGRRWWQCRRCLTYVDTMREFRPGITELVPLERVACPDCGLQDFDTVEGDELKPEHNQMPGRFMEPFGPEMGHCLREAQVVVDESGLCGMDVVEDADQSPAWARPIVVALVAGGLRLAQILEGGANEYDVQDGQEKV